MLQRRKEGDHKKPEKLTWLPDFVVPSSICSYRAVIVLINLSALRIIKPNVDGHVLVFNDGCSLQQSQLMFAGPRGPLMKLLLFSADVREAGRDVVIKTSVPDMVNKPTDHLVRFCLYLKGCKSFSLIKKRFATCYI